MDQETTTSVVHALRDAGARFAFLHGSRATGRSRPDSDIDIAAWWGGREPPIFPDVALPERCDLVVLDRAPLWLAGRIALDGVLLFDDDPPARVEWQADTRLRYLDELPQLEEYAREYLEAVARRDPERLSRLLARVRADVGTLGKFRDDVRKGIRDLSEPESPTLDAVKYRFVTAIEGCARIAQHIIASEGWGRPNDNADAIRMLAPKSVVSPDVAERVARAVGFRNVLVHQYVDVDNARVVAALDGVDDLDEYVTSIAKWATVS